MKMDSVASVFLVHLRQANVFRVVEAISAIAKTQYIREFRRLKLFLPSAKIPRWFTREFGANFGLKSCLVELNASRNVVPI